MTGDLFLKIKRLSETAVREAFSPVTNWLACLGRCMTTLCRLLWYYHV